MDNIKNPVRNVLMPMVLLAFLFMISRLNYLFFHILVDGFAVTVSILTFVIAEQTVKHSKNYYTVFLGYTFLFEGIIMLFHVLTYKGMAVFPYYTSDTPTQLWIAGRYISSLSLLAAPFFIKKKTPFKSTLAIYASVTVLLLVLILWYPVFPDCFIEGVGLTPFKIYSEYLSITILIAAIVHHIYHKEEIGDSLFKTMIKSIGFSILSGLSFTLYNDVYGLTNFLGHTFIALSTYLIYKAIFLRGIDMPYERLVAEISYSRDTEEALRESEERFRTIFENTSIGIKLVDQYGRIIMSNPAFQKMLGYSCAELNSLDISQISYGTDKDIMLSRFEDLISGKIDGFKLEKRYVKKHNQVIIANTTASLVSSSLIRSKFVIIMAEDITRQREIEANLLQMQKKEEISHRLASIGSLAAGIAHEINQPLNSVIVLVESMLYWLEKKQEISKEELTENLREISSQADEINEIILNLRSLIRKEAKLQPDLYNLNDNIELVLNSLNNRNLINDILITKNFGFLPPIMGNPTTLNEVINNLIVNAIQAFSTTERVDKEIIVSTYMDSHNTYLEVSDNAIGIKEGIKDKLFEPFFTTKDVGEGSGLGLSIVHTILAYHGGSIECSSNDRGGATFVVSLPLVEVIESRDNK